MTIAKRIKTASTENIGPICGVGFIGAAGLLQNATNIPALAMAAVPTAVWLFSDKKTIRSLGQASIVALAGAISIGGLIPQTSEKNSGIQQQPTAVAQVNTAVAPADKMSALMAQVAKLDPKQQETLMQGIAKLGEPKGSEEAGKVAGVSLQGAVGTTVDRSGDIDQTVNWR